MKGIESVILQLFEVLCHLLPVNSKKVFFQSFAGQYNDNPKAVSERMHERYPEIKIYWSISSKSKQNDIPEYIHKVQYGTIKHIYLRNRCKVVIENGAGLYLYNTSNTILAKLKRHLKNKKQFDLSTWHGNPIKHIGAQIPNSVVWTSETAYSSSDLLLAGCHLIKGIFEQAFINLMPVELLGTPRTDILFDKSESRKNAIKEKLGLPSQKKVILYAPTYRYSPKDSGIFQLQMMNFDALFNALQERFGGEWVFVMRVHNMVLLNIERSGLLDQYKDRLFNGNQFDDMNDYLYVCDVLISDYSGCIYDVALTDKPCFLFAHDREYYEQHERGLYTPLSAFPYQFANTFSELLDLIAGYNYERQEQQRVDFLRMIGNIEDGHAADRVIDKIFSILQK